MKHYTKLHLGFSSRPVSHSLFSRDNNDGETTEAQHKQPRNGLSSRSHIQTMEKIEKICC